MNENAIHGAPEKGKEWRIALSNHYAWLQTRGWRTHELPKAGVEDDPKAGCELPKAGEDEAPNGEAG